MQIIDFSSPSPSLNHHSRIRVGLEILTATLIFVLPMIALFVLAK